MTINNVPINKGDCVICCATEHDGYHYIMSFAFKAEDINDDKVVCIFHEISFDDFVVGYYPENKILDNMYLPPAYDIYIVNENAMNKFISNIKSIDELDEDNVWEFFEQANQNAIKIIQKDRS